MSSLEGFSLQNCLVPIEIKRIRRDPHKKKPDEETYRFCVDAYSIDESDLNKRVGMAGYHSCDYIFVNDDKVILIEDSNLIAKWEDLEKEYLRLAKGKAWEEEQTFEEIQSHKDSKRKYASKGIEKEQVLKAYAGLLLLHRLSLLHEESRNLIKQDEHPSKQLLFLLIVNDATKSSVRMFESLKHDIDGYLSPLVESFVSYPEEAERKLKDESFKKNGNGFP